MNERVSVREGKIPIIIIAPHGYDDPHTDIIAEQIAETLDCYAVINRGWERSSTVDVFEDKANCNNISHIHKDVVKDEFLDPIRRYTTRLTKQIVKNSSIFLQKVFILSIHGVSNTIRSVESQKIDIVLGYGAGKPNSYTCELWKKNNLAFLLRKKGRRMCVWEGRPGGAFAAWGKNNITQLYRKKYPENWIDSLQIEIVRSPWRDTPNKARITGCIIANALLELLLVCNTHQKFKNIPQC